MPTLRFYIDKKIDPTTKEGGEHSREIDITTPKGMFMDQAQAEAEAQAQLGSDEVINSCVELPD